MQRQLLCHCRRLLAMRIELRLEGELSQPRLLNLMLHPLVLPRPLLGLFMQPPGYLAGVDTLAIFVGILAAAGDTAFLGLRTATSRTQ